MALWTRLVQTQGHHWRDFTQEGITKEIKKPEIKKIEKEIKKIEKEIRVRINPVDVSKIIDFDEA